MARKSDSIRDKSRENLNQLIKETGLSQEKFGQSLGRDGYAAPRQQQISRYLSGENDIPVTFAREVARVYKCRPDWLLGESEYRTHAELAVAVAESRENRENADKEHNRKMAFFELLVQLSGWHFVPFPDDVIHRGMDIAAPYGESDSTAVGIEKMKNFMRIGKDGRAVTISEVEYDNLMERMLAHFDFEMQHTRFESEIQQALKEHGLEDR